MSKFRIPIQEVIVIPDITAPPSNATKAWFDALTRDLVRKDSDHSDLSSTGIGHDYFSHLSLLIIRVEFTRMLHRRVGIDGPQEQNVPSHEAEGVAAAAFFRC